MFFGKKIMDVILIISMLLYALCPMPFFSFGDELEDEGGVQIMEAIPTVASDISDSDQTEQDSQSSENGQNPGNDRDAQNSQEAQATANGQEDENSQANESGAENQNTQTDTGGAPSNMPNLAVEAKAAVLIDADTGMVLYEQNSHEKLPPASVTKVMTMLLVMEAVDRGQISLTDQVTISEKAASMGGSQMYMEPGEVHTLEELMMGISIVSANDGCVAAAEYVAGSMDIFVEMMNKRAQELEMNDTHFVNTNGLPVADHYTSAYDIAVMSRELLKHDKVKEWFNTWMTTLKVGLKDKQTELGLTNTNKMIKQYSGANGIKTGFTQDAGYCLSASATRNDLTLIAVILGAETSKIRFSEASRLLDYGFATYEAASLAQKGEIIAAVPVEKGKDLQVNAVTQEKISMLVLKGEKDSVTKQIELNGKITAPVEAGQTIGQIRILKNDTVIGEYPLVAENAVEKINLLSMYMRILQQAC